MYAFWRRCALVLGLVGLLVGGWSTPEARAANPLVERISFAERSDGQGYVVRIHTSEHVSAYSEPRLTDDHRLEWTLFNTGVAASYERGTGMGPISKYTAQTEEGHLILRFELADDAAVEPTAYRDRASSDLLLNLAYAPGASPVVAEASELPVRETAGGTQEQAWSAGERWRLNTVVIDAGHGGKDPGASAHGVREKDVVLGIALKLGEYIEENMEGVQAVYTREDDHFVTLRDRGHIANRAGGKLFISIHANAAGNRSARGTETYFLGMHRNESARQVMERENSVVQLEENPEQYEDFDEEELALQALTQSAYMRQSEHLADLLQDQFAERVGRVDRGVKQAGFIVLWGASMPAVLVETGFVTNREEAAFLSSEDGQVYLASAIFRAVRDFKERYEMGLHLGPQ